MQPMQQSSYMLMQELIRVLHTSVLPGTAFCPDAQSSEVASLSNHKHG